MKRLTVHLTNVEKVKVNGKSKLFNTRTFMLKKGTPKEIGEVLSNLTGVKKHYLSNVV